MGDNLVADGRNKNGTGSVHEFFYRKAAGWTPVVGGGNGDGKAKIGIYRQGNRRLDDNVNGLWDGTPTDMIKGLGQAGDLPVTGKWKKIKIINLLLF
jgi:hypothetical protein